MNKNVVVLAEAASDIERGIDFYNAIEDGVGLSSRDSIIADLRRIGVYFGAHRIHLDHFRGAIVEISLRHLLSGKRCHPANCRSARPAALTGMAP